MIPSVTIKSRKNLIGTNLDEDSDYQIVNTSSEISENVNEHFQAEYIANGSDEEEIYISSDEEQEENYPTRKHANWKLVTQEYKLIAPQLSYAKPISNIPQNVLDQMLPIELFRLFFDDELMNMIIDQTNFYYSWTKENSNEVLKDEPFSRLQNFKKVNRGEFEIFLGLFILMGIHSEHELADYWSTDLLLETQFGRFMGKTRFENILRFLHLEDNSKFLNSDNRLYKIQNFVDKLVNNWKQHFTCGTEINIDEGIIPYKGRLKFKQYMKQKPKKWGIKLFELCDSATGYVQKALVYPGKTTAEGLVSENIVKTLLEGFYDLNHVLYTDNFYTSLSMAEDLFQRNTGFVGVIRKDRIKSKEIEALKNEGHFYICSEYPNTILSVWYDKRPLYAISTIHVNTVIKKKIQTGQNTKEITKPLIIDNYNTNARGVDLANQLAQYFKCPHRTRKWWRSVFDHFIQLTLSNCFILHKMKKKEKFHS